MKKAVIISCFGWYERRLYYLYDRLTDIGYNVKIYVSDFQHINKKKIVYHDSRVCFIHVPQYTSNISLKRMYSHYCFAKKCYMKLLKDDPEFIYVLVPPNSCSAVVCRYKKKNPDTIIFTDIIDLWPESFPGEIVRKIPVSNVWKNMRDKCLELSECIILECEYYKNMIDRKLVRKCKIVRLYKNISIDDSKAVKRKLETYQSELNDKKIRLCYLGSINNIIDLQSIELILRAFVFKEYHVDLHIIGSGSAKEKLIKLCLLNNVKIYDFGEVFDENKKVEILSQCDFGLNLMLDRVKVGLTIKSIDYLSCGLPLINNIKGDTWNLVNEKKIGINFENDTEELIDKIKMIDIEELKYNAIKCYNECFTKKAFEDSFESVLTQLMHDKREK